MKTGPFKPAPDQPQGFYIAAEDRAKYMKALADGNRIDLAAEMGLSRELPDIEEQTIKRQMDLRATLVAYPDGETLDAQVSANLLR
jgi:hypothetical protein